MNAAQLRIGDAEREAAARDLGEHYAHGRISVEEHAERLDRIWAARTTSDLAPVFTDLPRLREPAPSRRSPGVGLGGRGSWAERLLNAVTPMPFLFKVLLAIAVVALVVSHLPFLVIALLGYLFFVRRISHRHRRQPRWR